ncbi:MAG: ribosome small subunit-dependent GTPase A [Eubacteriales bacterium]|nr:ribosome small subunit-dependent GTPase A [Eubacteriales bacterium]
MVNGKIIKAISGFYYVHDGKNTWTCRAKGVFRNIGIKPLVGDNVTVDIISEEKLEGNLVGVNERKSTLIRPAVANVTQALIVFAVREPDPNLGLLDRFLINMGKEGINTIIFFNKTDIDKDDAASRYKKTYEAAGYRVITGSTSYDETVSEIIEALDHNTTVLAGPSGAGKSSLTNRLNINAGMVVGELSEKLKRGKQTTRHTELFPVGNDGYVLDTPGFTSLYVTGVKSEDVSSYYEEFREPNESCKFVGCSHVNEPEQICMVKEFVKCGKIDKVRYESYCTIYREIKENEKKY